MQGVQRYLCGGFLGLTSDQHESPPPSDDEDGGEDKDLYMPRDYKAPVKKSKKRFAFMNRGGEWSQYRKTFTVEAVSGGAVTRRQFEGIHANKKDITPAMLKKLSSLKGMHTIEIISCKLNQQPPFFELINLVVLRLSKNEIRELLRPAAPDGEKEKPKSKAKGEAEKDVGQKTHRLESFYCDHNLLQNIEPGVFSGSQVANLMVLNLSYNQLSLLPFDFCSGARQLKLLDLSNNRLFSLPESMLDCRSLVVLNVDRNELERLPQEIGVLTGLRKLFASYNNLGELPQNIGDCRLLEKIRLVGNHIAYMPHSLLNLWSEKGGYLDELNVEGNPLMQPSITAFQMGGLNRALRLFGEHVREQKRQAQELLEQKAALQAAEEKPEAEAEKAEEKKGRPEPIVTSSLQREPTMDDEPLSPKEEDPELEVVTMNVKGRRMSVVQPKNAPAIEDAEVEAGELPTTALAAGDMYYFSTGPGDWQKMQTEPALVLEVRSAETMLLLRKKNTYVQKLKASALSLAKTSVFKADDLPGEMQHLLQVDFDVSRFAGRVEVMDLDLHFCLLVYGAKSAFTNVYMIWDKFETGGKDYLTQDEWLNLCTRIKTKLPTDARMGLWEYLAWRKDDQILYSDFVAGWHIHDTEISDPHIQRLSQVLKLDFYGMSIKELEKRLKLRLGEEAELSMQMENRVFGQDDHRPVHDDHNAGVALPMGEGERRMRSPRETAELRARQERRDALQEALKDEGVNLEEEIMQSRISEAGSTSNKQHFQISTEGLDAQDSESEGEVESMDSFCLSNSVASSQESFDAQLAVFEQEAWEMRVAFVEQPGDNGSPMKGLPAEVEDDEDIARLMDVPPSVLLMRQQMQMEGSSGANMVQTLRKRKKKVKKEEKTKRLIRDHRFKTDVMRVRQAIRGAFRNMPFNDFKALVMYFSRNLKRFKSSVQDAGAVVYLHADDPIFRNATGLDEINPYAKDLMLEMGFVCLNDSFWVWPCRHVMSQDESSLWLPQLVPQNCPGKDKRRLHDMIDLINICSSTIQKEGSDFTGHMRH